MMLYPAMNKLKSHIPNRYMLVNVVALRAREIAQSESYLGRRPAGREARDSGHP